MPLPNQGVKQTKQTPSKPKQKNTKCLNKWPSYLLRLVLNNNNKKLKVLQRASGDSFPINQTVLRYLHLHSSVTLHPSVELSLFKIMLSQPFPLYSSILSTAQSCYASLHHGRNTSNIFQCIGKKLITRSQDTLFSTFMTIAKVFFWLVGFFVWLFR